jgi:hypothetical protein
MLTLLLVLIVHSLLSLPSLQCYTVLEAFSNVCSYLSLSYYWGSVHKSICCSDRWFFIIIFFSGVRLSPLGTAATTGLLYQRRMIDDGDCGAIGAMKIGRGSRSIRRKPAQPPLCPPQIPHDLTWTRTRAAAVGSRRLTAWAMARSYRQFVSK